MLNSTSARAVLALVVAGFLLTGCNIMSDNREPAGTTEADGNIYVAPLPEDGLEE